MHLFLAGLPFGKKRMLDLRICFFIPTATHTPRLDIESRHVLGRDGFTPGLTVTKRLPDTRKKRFGGGAW